MEARVTELNNETIRAVNILTEFVDESEVVEGNRDEEKVLRDREACIQALIAAAKIFGLHLVGKVKM